MSDFFETDEFGFSNQRLNQAGFSVSRSQKSFACFIGRNTIIFCWLLKPVLPEVIPETEYAHSHVEKIHAQNFDEPPATLSTWASAFNAFTQQAADAGIDDGMPKLVRSWFDLALAMGLGEEDIIALIKIFRNTEDRD